VLFAQKCFPTASELLPGGSIVPPMQNFLLGRPRTGSSRLPDQLGVYGGEQLLRDA
jgi:hypothetical protein